MRWLAIFVGLALLALGLAGSSSASFVAGTLDPTFGYGAIVTHSPVPNEGASIDAVAVQPGGKIVTAAVSGRDDDGLLLARYVPSGLPDTDFGVGGYVETHIGDWAKAEAVAVQPDGRSWSPEHAARRKATTSSPSSCSRGTTRTGRSIRASERTGS
jgi:hypothetical protein